MATKITVALEDDLDGGPASETVRFGLGGAQYEIDLNKKNARAFRKKLAPFVEHARKAGPGQRRGPARTASSRQRSVDIRAWAKAAGLPVSDRGRIPASVVDQYEATTRRPLRTPGHHRHDQSAQTVSGRGRPVDGVPDPSGCPPIAA
jgi:Lsr2